MPQRWSLILWSLFWQSIITRRTEQPNIADLISFSTLTTALISSLLQVARLGLEFSGALPKWTTQSRMWQTLKTIAWGRWICKPDRHYIMQDTANWHCQQQGDPVHCQLLFLYICYLQRKQLPIRPFTPTETFSSHGLRGRSLPLLI